MAKGNKGNGKRAKTAYIFFTMDKRNEVAEKNPDMKQKDILKELGRLWKEMPEDEKEKYKKQAEEDKKRVAEDKKNSPAEEKKSKPKKGKKAEPEDEDENEEEGEDDE